ncbi:1-phosphofructokinase [Streptomyces alkaliterrae]|uniref:1-phosphofructokinase n=2 Tax=Streptomyces alkaliterrae TaxID=2213162 RepID=A0A7W3X0I7_9ACTN|nr:1-phosphofructokinase [Streptomyces alkaliterrae]MBB1261891.1 1-phosphofructokinase [Streptomyces alkaliterrae]
MTLLTVTPNPSLDRSYEIPALGRGEVLRATVDRVDPGGKGVNVSRAVAAAGRHTVAVLPLGGPEGALLETLLGEQGIAVAGVVVAGSTRVNAAAVEPDGTVTKINAPGPHLTDAEGRALLDAVRARVADHATSWVACCGSLPRGLPPAWYADLVAAAHEAGARVAVDTSGPALRAALSRGADVVKPNTFELAEAVARPLGTLGDVLKAAEELRQLGARGVLASLGPDGQLLVDDTGAHYGRAPVREVRSNVGAGDASLAGLLVAGGEGPEALSSSLRYGAAAVSLPGSQMPTPDDLHDIPVDITTDLPLALPLADAG